MKDSVVFSVRVSVELAMKINEAATKAGVKRNAWVEAALTEALMIQAPSVVEVARPGESRSEGEAPSGSSEQSAPVASRQGSRPAVGAANCSHPKGKRKNLGYTVVCGICGEKLT